MKKQLDTELQHLNFTKHQLVLDHIRTMTWKQKVKLVWNKEVEVPLLPIGAVFVACFLMIGLRNIAPIQNNPTFENRDQLVEIEGYVYVKDDLEKAGVWNED